MNTLKLVKRISDTNYLPQRLLFLLGFTLILGSGLSIWYFQATSAQTKPLTYPEILTALNSKLPNAAFKTKSQMISWLMMQIERRKVDKTLTSDREEDLRQAGATDQLIETIRNNSPSSPIIMSTPEPRRTPTPIITTITRPTPTPSPKVTISPNNSNFFKNSIGMEFVQLPRGVFRMGSDVGTAKEKPAHRVTISKSFWMEKRK